MIEVRVTSPINLNYRQRGEVEAWFYDGTTPFEQWPDWIRSHYINNQKRAGPTGREKNHYALRDKEGFFWRWMKADLFDLAYERKDHPLSVSQS
jgi:hypothetical protein